MKFFDDKSKGQVKWNNRNYFYIGTILLVVINIIIFYNTKLGWEHDLYNYNAKWEDFAPLNVISAMFHCLSHSSVSHLMGNMIGLGIMGIYLERKIGTLNFIYLNIIFMFCACGLTSHTKGNVYHHGYSGVNFALYAFVIIDFIISLKKENRSVLNIIFGIIAVGYAYIFSMSWGGGAFIDVTYYPHNLIHNMGHYSGFVIGLLIGGFYQLNKRKVKNNGE